MLKFTPYAYHKLLYFRDKGAKDNIEVGCWGVSSKNDVTLVENVFFPKQECTGATFDIDSDSTDDYMQDMAELGYQPFQCTRILIHSHPSASNTPSGVDEETFNDFFEKCGWHWGIMCIVATNDTFYCRLKIAGPGMYPISVTGKVTVDWKSKLQGADYDAWDKEYDDNVKKKSWQPLNFSNHYYGHANKWQRNRQQRNTSTNGYSGSFVNNKSNTSKNTGGTNSQSSPSTIGVPFNPYEWDDSEYYSHIYDIDDSTDIPDESIILKDEFPVATVPTINNDGKLKKNKITVQTKKKEAKEKKEKKEKKMNAWYKKKQALIPSEQSLAIGSNDDSSPVIYPFDNDSILNGKFYCSMDGKFLSVNGLFRTKLTCPDCVFESVEEISSLLSTKYNLKPCVCIDGQGMEPEKTQSKEYQPDFTWDSWSPTPGEKTEIATILNMSVADCEELQDWIGLAKKAGCIMTAN